MLPSRPSPPRKDPLTQIPCCTAPPRSSPAPGLASRRPASPPLDPTLSLPQARTLVEKIGKTLELDTDGIWCVLPACFPQTVVATTSNPAKPTASVSYPCVMLNVDVDQMYNNPQYQTKNDATGAPTPGRAAAWNSPNPQH